MIYGKYKLYLDYKCTHQLLLFWDRTNQHSNLCITNGLKSNVSQKDLSNLWILQVMNKMLFKLLDVNSSMFHILLDWWYGYGAPFEDELLIFNIYDITSTFPREPAPKNFTNLVNMNLSIYSFLDRFMLALAYTTTNNSTILKVKFESVK
jgi:hypothetical protein